MTYRPDYYAAQYGGALESARLLLPAALGVLAGGGRRIESLADLGCGSGAWCDAAVELGIPRVVGFDGAWCAVQSASRAWEFRENDLRVSIVGSFSKFDVVLCLEVVEHIETRFEANIFDSISALSDAVLFSGAVPGQGGVDHVNERPWAHWAARLMARGYQEVAIDVPEGCLPWYRANAGLWVRL